MKRLLFSLVILALFYYPAPAVVFASQTPTNTVSAAPSIQAQTQVVSLQVLSAPAATSVAVASNPPSACFVPQASTETLVQDQAVLNFNISSACFKLSLGALAATAPLRVINNAPYAGKIIVNSPAVIKDELESSNFPAGGSEPFLPQPIQLIILSAAVFSLTYKSRKGRARIKSFSYQASLTQLQVLRC